MRLSDATIMLPAYAVQRFCMGESVCLYCIPVRGSDPSNTVYTAAVQSAMTPHGDVISPSTTLGEGLVYYNVRWYHALYPVYPMGPCMLCRLSCHRVGKPRHPTLDEFDLVFITRTPKQMNTYLSQYVVHGIDGKDTTMADMAMVQGYVFNGRRNSL